MIVFEVMVTLPCWRLHGRYVRLSRFGLGLGTFPLDTPYFITVSVSTTADVVGRRREGLKVDLPVENSG
jgi:hypothetical protein